MPKNREKSEEKEKEQKEEGKHSNIERGHNAIKSKNLLHEDQRACKSDWWEDLNELKTQTPYTTNMQLIREKTRIKQTKIRSMFSSLDKQSRRLDINKRTQSEHQR